VKFISGSELYTGVQKCLFSENYKLLIKCGIGAALIGVLEDSECPKQKFRGYSPPWSAPEKAKEMNALGLRRMDMYLYGLTIWRIMCNGQMPYNKLFWDFFHKNITSEPETTPPQPLSSLDFIALKKRGDTILHLAIDTLKHRPESDVDLEKVQAVLKVTLGHDPASRATSFSEIVNILNPRGSITSTLQYASKLPTSHNRWY